MTHELEYIDDEPTIHLTQQEFDNYIRHAQFTALESAEQALNRECLGFQRGWGSNPEDVAKLEVLSKTLTWLRERASKYLDTLPRSINLKDSYKKLSDGAQIKYYGETFTHRIGHGDFVSSVGDTIVARLHDENVALVSHNLDLTKD